MLRGKVDVWMSTAAAVLSGGWGAVTRRAQQTGVSRTAIYTHAQRVVRAVGHEQAGGLSSEGRWADHTRLRAAHEALWEAWAAEQPAEATQQQCSATACALGLRLGQLITLLALWLPPGRAPGRATVGRWVAQTSRQAGRRLTGRDPLCQQTSPKSPLHIWRVKATLGYAHSLKQQQLLLGEGRVPLPPSPLRAIQSQGLLGMEREQSALA